MSAVQPVAYTAESVFKTVESANRTYETLKKAMETMDRNILNDMQILFDRQQETTNAITELSRSLSTEQSTKLFSTQTVAIGAGVLLAVGFCYGVSLERKRSNLKGTNRG